MIGIQRAIDFFLGRLFPTGWKERQELKYWRARQQKEGVLRNVHYAAAYTDPWRLAIDDYSNRRVLDIGCGPRGSLEWADSAALRIGLDPLAASYVEFGIRAHRMHYVPAGAEAMPFPDAAFDTVCAFNSLDHVEDVHAAVSEITRVTRAGGLILVIVDVNHPPTATEPHSLAPDFLEQFEPQCEVQDLRVYAPHPGGAYDSIRTGDELPHPATTPERGWLAAKLRKK